MASIYHRGFISPACDKTSGMKQLCIRPMRNLLFLNNGRSVMNESFQLCLIKKSSIQTLLIRFKVIIKCTKVYFYDFFFKYS